jgi:hypothetical protein
MDAQQQFREAGACNAVIEVLNIHFDNPKVAKSASGAIAALAADETNRGLLIESGACEVLVKAFVSASADKDKETLLETKDVLLSILVAMRYFVNRVDGFIRIKDQLTELIGEDLTVNILNKLCDNSEKNEEE